MIGDYEKLMIMELDALSAYVNLIEETTKKVLSGEKIDWDVTNARLDEANAKLDTIVAERKELERKRGYNTE